MLKAVIIENFQSHKKSTFRVDSNLNIIHGLSDSGKSSIRRAIEAVINRGPFYLRWGAGKGKVTLIFDDIEVTRFYKKTNTLKCPSCKCKLEGALICPDCEEVIPNKPAEDYYLIKTEDSEFKYEKFGTTIPPEIFNKLRMGAIQFGEFSVNLSISTQFEDMFFIGNSYNGNFRNRLISALVPDSENIDKTIKEMSSEKNELTNSNKYMKKEFDEIDHTLLLIDGDMEEITTIYTEYCELDTIQESEQMKLGVIKSIKSQMGNLKMCRIASSTIEKFKSHVGDLKQFLERTMDIDEKCSKMRSVVSSMGELTLIDTEVPEFDEYFNSSADEIHEITVAILKLKTMKSEIQSLKIISEKIPELKNLNPLITKISDDMEMIGVLAQTGSDYTKLKESIEKLMEDRELAKKITSEFIETFKQENPTLICPHRKDVYADECLQLIPEKD